jgi:uncharacterized membrane protein required for colicin V production
MMQLLDVGLAGAVVVWALRGASRGFFREAFTSLGMLAGLYAAVISSQRLSALIAGHFMMPPATEVIEAAAFVGLFAGMTVIGGVVGFLLQLSIGRGVLERVGGAIVSAARAAMVVAAALLFVQLFVPGADATVRASRVGRGLVGAASAVLRSAVPQDDSKLASGRP